MSHIFHGVGNGAPVFALQLGSASQREILRSGHGLSETEREANVPGDEIPIRRGFDEAMAGKTAECDGGGHIPGTQYAGRQEFTGTLTGEYIDHGDPPWRWYLMVSLTRKPESYDHDAVWCESGNLFLIDEKSS